MKTLATKEKQLAPAARNARPYVHHPMGPVQQAQRAEIRHILRFTGAQAKLTIGKPNDKYEQEADRVADQVMRMPDPSLQRQPEAEEEEETVQAKPLANQITPLMQRARETSDNPYIQRQEHNNRHIQRAVPKYNPTPEAMLLEPPCTTYTNLPAFNPNRLEMLGFKLIKGKFSKNQQWKHSLGHEVNFYQTDKLEKGLTPYEQKFGRINYEVQSRYKAILRYYENGVIERLWIAKKYSEFFKWQEKDKLWVHFNPDSGDVYMYHDEPPE